MLRVNIYDDKFIPGVGVGPATDVILSKASYRDLVQLGYHIEVLDNGEDVSDNIPSENKRHLNSFHISNTVVPVSSWVADTTMESEGFGFKAIIKINKLDVKDVVEVTFSPADVYSSNFSATVINNEYEKLSIFAKAIPTDDITIPNIIVWCNRYI